MITTILIVLVAVVVLIVIIAVLALHFLRADDSDAFDEVSAEPRAKRGAPVNPPREPDYAAADQRQPRRGEPDRAPWTSDRPGRAGDERSLRVVDDRLVGYRDRDTGPRPAPADRRNGQPSGQRPIAAAARPAKSAKVASTDATTAAWDSLSDVDYWAELAADKPQVSPAPPAPTAARSNGSAKRGHNASPNGDIRPARRPESGPVPASQHPSGPLPVRSRSQLSRPSSTPPAAAAGRSGDLGQTEQPDTRAARAYGSEPTTQSLAALARLSEPQSAGGLRSAGGQRSGASARRGSAPRPAGIRPGPGQRPVPPSTASTPAASLPPAGYGRSPIPADDDPLTSPSFPAVNAADSRSYRTRRPGNAQSGQHLSPQSGQHLSPQSGQHLSPQSGQHLSPQSGQHLSPQSGQHLSPQSGQHLSPQSGPQYVSGPAPVSPPFPAPVANPYGSYVSASQPVYQDVAPDQDAASYGGYSTGAQSDASSWYHGSADGYLPAGYGANGHGANGHGANGHGANGHAANGNGYAAVDYQNAAYQNGSAAQNGYGPQGQLPGQYDHRGYSTPDPGPVQDGYQGYPGYGAGGR